MAHLKRHVDDELFYCETAALVGEPSKSDRKVEKDYGANWEPRNLSPTNLSDDREFGDFEDFETGEWDNYTVPGGEVLSDSERA
jgi:hypothetical protein